MESKRRPTLYHTPSIAERKRWLLMAQDLCTSLYFISSSSNYVYNSMHVPVCIYRVLSTLQLGACLMYLCLIPTHHYTVTPVVVNIHTNAPFHIAPGYLQMCMYMYMNLYSTMYTCIPYRWLLSKSVFKSLFTLHMYKFRTKEHPRCYLAVRSMCPVRVPISSGWHPLSLWVLRELMPDCIRHMCLWCVEVICFSMSTYGLASA